MWKLVPPHAVMGFNNPVGCALFPGSIKGTAYPPFQIINSSNDSI